MTKLLSILLLAIGSIMAAGCDKLIDCDDCHASLDVDLDIEGNPDTRVRIWDDNYRGHWYEGAFVKVVSPPPADPKENPEGGWTDADGWTPWFTLSRKFANIEVSITYQDELGNDHTVYRWFRREIDETAPILTINTNVP